MRTPPKLSRSQTASLLFSGIFFVVTWTVGGQSGYSTGLAYALPWVIASLAAVLMPFAGFIKDAQKQFDVGIASVVLSMVDFGMMPLSWLVINPLSWLSISIEVSVTGLVVAVSLVSYAWYVIRLARRAHPSTKTEKGQETIDELIVAQLPHTTCPKPYPLLSVHYDESDVDHGGLLVGYKIPPKLHFIVNMKTKRAFWTSPLIDSLAQKGYIEIMMHKGENGLMEYLRKNYVEALQRYPRDLKEELGINLKDLLRKITE